MGQVADRSSDIIVLLIGQNQGDSAQGSHQLAEGMNPGSFHFPAGSQNIIGVLKQQSLRAPVACPLTAGHGMPADKLLLKPGLFDMKMNICLDAAHICQKSL